MGKLLRVGAAFAASALLWSTAAHATMITEWNYSLLTRFSGNNTFRPGYPTQVETETQVSWGDPSGDVFVSGSGRSGITLADLDTPPGENDPAADPITGQVTTRNVHQRPAPSIIAASRTSCGTPCNAARSTTEENGTSLGMVEAMRWREAESPKSP